MVPIDELRERSPRSKSFRLLATGAAVLVAVGLVTFGLLTPAPDTSSRDVRAPEFRLPLLSGGTLSSDELRGSPVVLNFWASWCIPCRREAPLLERTWRAYKDDGIKVIGVNLEDSNDSAKAFVQKFDVTYPVIVDEQKRLYEELLEDGLLELDGLPQTLFLDRRWRLADAAAGGEAEDGAGRVVLGAISRDDLTRGIENISSETGE
jgi:cytochrome c biogenesis protein CcmG, thiol:disulfide interchange protein DsbE